MGFGFRPSALWPFLDLELQLLRELSCSNIKTIRPIMPVFFSQTAIFRNLKRFQRYPILLKFPDPGVAR